MLQRWILMVVVLLGVGSMAMACGESSEPNPPQQGDGGGGGNEDPNDCEDVLDEDCTGGEDPGDEEPTDPEPTLCEQACDQATDQCGWLDQGSGNYEAERTACIELCEDAPTCVPDSIATCDVRAFESCFLSPAETEACAAMCDHIYYECDMTFGVSRAECGLACSAGAFEEELVACFTASSCDLDEMNSCLEDEEPEVDECEVACAHVVDECGNDTWSSTSCLRACKAAYTEEEKECLSNLECGSDPVESCFGEFSCQAMCDHVYNTCGSSIGDGDHETCEVFCRFGMMSDTEVTCFSSAACGDLEACDETLAP